jgi:hypothetical protein
MAQDFDDLFDAPEIPRTIAAAYLGGLKVAVSDLLVHRVASRAAKSLDAEGLGKHLRKATEAITANKGAPVARKQGRIRDAMNLERHQRRNSGVYDKVAADVTTDPVAAEPVASPEEQAMAEMAPGAADVPVEEAGASPEELSLHLAELVSHEFKMHQWYIYYAEMIRGADRSGLVELFEELAPLELEDGRYFAKRLSVLGPGTVIPVTPNPEPLQDAMQIAAKMLQEEQRAVMLLQNFHTLCGEDPMRFQVEQMMADEQVHADRLQQFMAVAQAAAPKKSKSEKIAAAVQQMKQELVVQPQEQEQAQQLAVEELKAQNAQLTAERADLSQRLQGVSQMAQQHMQQAQDAAVMQQQLGDESAQAQEQAMMAQQQAQSATQEAADHAQVAAMEADAKMRLGIRIQQMRQRLSELVTEDPVAEEGADMPAIPTSTQQAGMMDPMQDPAAQDPAAAGADPMQDPAAEGGTAAEPPAETTTEPAKPSSKPKDKDPKPKAKNDADDAKVEVKVGSHAVQTAAGLGLLGAGAYAGYKGGQRGARSAQEKADGKPVSESSPGLRRAALVGGSLLSLGVPAGYLVGRLQESKKEASVVQRAGQLVTGSKKKELLGVAKHNLENEAFHRARGDHELATRSLSRHLHHSGAAKQEGRKVNVTRGALAGVALGAGTAAKPDGEKVSSVLQRAGQLVTGSKARSLSREAGDHLNEAKAWMGRAASDRAKAVDPALHGGEKAMRLVGARSAEASEGRAIKRHWDASSAAKTEQGKVNRARAAVGGVAGGAALGASGGSEPKVAGALNRIVSRLHGAGKKLEDRAKGHAVAKGKEMVHEIADNPETKKRLEHVARDAGHHAVDQASKHPAIGEAKRGLERGAKRLAGVTAGSAAVSTGTSIYQGNKTRKAIKEAHHG